MNQLVTIVLYLLFVGIVIFSASRASNYVDEIDRKTNIGGALLGGIVLAGITSLPELITTISSSAIVGKPGLAFGNIFGSNLFNLVILALADIYFYKKHFLQKIDIKENLRTNIIVTALYIAILIPLALDVLVFKDIELFFITTGQLSLISVVILAIYALNIRRLLDDSGDNAESDNKEEKVKSDKKESIKLDVIMLAVWSVALVMSSILITYFTGEITDILGINESFGGALFLGIATSLPEMTAVYTLVKKDNFDAAASNVIGSNIFNLVILSFVDLIIFENVYSTLLSNESIQGNVAALIILGLINVLVFMYILKRKKKERNMFTYMLPSIIIILNYLGYLAVSAGTFDFLLK